MRTAKIACLIVVEIALALMLFSPVLVNRRSHVQAFVAWRNNPTLETEARWKEENSRLHRDMMIVDLALLGALIANTVGLVMVIRRRKTRHNQTLDATSEPAPSADSSAHHA
jgi:hypothetical protein